MSAEGNLIWLDLEMTGLDPAHDRILEIATIVTDSHLNIIAEGPDIVIHQPESALENLDPWVNKQHTSTGLFDQVRQSKISDREAEIMTLQFIQKYVQPGQSPMSGNSIYQDRRFLYHYMPELEKYFHYRNLDVSTVKELARRWQPKLYDTFKKESRHRALDDIRDSIAELTFYRDHFFKSLPQ